MLNFIPRFEVATLRPPQTRLISKLGGLPWGFPVGMWPYCRECTLPMALLAQLPHQGPEVDFGDSRWVLHIFQCATAGCDTMSYDGGCNAALMLPREALGEGLTQAPEPTRERPIRAWTSGSVPVEHSMHGELWLTGWQEHDDAVPQHLGPAYFHVDTFYALPEELQFPDDYNYQLRTKSGGVPYWTAAAGPTEVPHPFEYLLQIDTAIPIQGRLPDPSEVGCDVYVHHASGETEEIRRVPSAAKRENAPWSVHQLRDEVGDYQVEFANFGSDGTAYVFIDRETTPPRAIFFWNR